MTSGVLNLVLKRLAIAVVTLSDRPVRRVLRDQRCCPATSRRCCLARRRHPKPSPACARPCISTIRQSCASCAGFVGLLHGDLGTSYANEMPVAELIGAALRQLHGARRHHHAALGAAGADAGHHRRDVCAAASTTALSPFCAIAVISVPEFMVATLGGAALRRLSANGCRRCPRSRGAYARPAVAAHLSRCR